MGYDKDKSEYDIMNSMKNFYRIYDSGQTKWLWKKNINLFLSCLVI